MYDESMLGECFGQLISSFNKSSVYDFASKLYLIENKDTSYIGSLERLVYTLGDSSEVYTKKEREFISKVTEVIIFSPFELQGKKSRVQCCLITVDLSELCDPVYNSIAFMKICNKALSGFNVYLISTRNSVYVGYDDLVNNSTIGCNISYPITEKANWDSLQNNFLYINSQDFRTYYQTLCDAVAMVYECYENSVEIDDSIYYYDEENSEYLIYDFSKETDLIESVRASYENYLIEVEDLQRDLSFIKANKVNTLELLIDAEKFEERLNNQETIVSTDKSNDIDLSEYSDLLDDPEALIKLLKKRNI